MNKGTTEKIPFWLDPEKRSIMAQMGVLAMFGLLVWYLVSNTLGNLEKQSIATGFGFLSKESAFEIGESLISYSAADTYAKALLVGVLNTLKVAFIGIVISIILGAFIGTARLSGNWLVSKLAGIYIEVMQDIPVLLQLFFWYTIFYGTLPSPRQALNPIKGLFLCNRGVVFAVPDANPAHKYIFLAFILGCVLVYLVGRWAKNRQERTGKSFPVFRLSVVFLIGPPLLTWVA